MTVIVFLIDTSASMMQKSYLGTTYLDFARLTVEQFLKHRQRDPASSGDRYMLMTFEEYPYNIKSGWKESQRIFNEQLKGLKAKGLANFEQSLESVMRLLTINRMQTGAGSGIENYGFGRFPSFAEHVVIVPVIDGSELPAANNEAQVPKPRLLVGNDLTTEAFRWDQRLFPIVLRLSGHQHAGIQQQAGMVPTTDRSIAETYAAQMGGRSFAITSHRTLFHCIDNIMQRIQSNGVFVRFQKHGPDPPPPPAQVADEQSKKANGDQQKDKSPSPDGAGGGAYSGNESWPDSLVLMKPRMGSGSSFWPIPEAFWPDTVRNSLPPRHAHPVVFFKCDRAEPMFNPEFPLDKYELDSSSPLVQYMLSRKEPNLCWQVYIDGSYKQPGIGLPFGYIRVSSASAVQLLVMPYNYPDLLTLLTQAKEGPKVIASVPFQQRFDKYLNTVPSYYYSYLKKQLNRLKISPPSLEEANTRLYGYINLGTHHMKMKQQGQQEYEIACAAVVKYLNDPMNANFGPNPAAMVKVSRSRALLGKEALTQCAFRPAMALAPHRSLVPADSFRDLCVSLRDSTPTYPVVPPSQQFKNPFDIPRANLCAQLDKMRINFDQQVQCENTNLHVFQGGPPGQRIKLQHAEDLANLPIGKMGIYEDYTRGLIAIGMGPKRELEPQAAKPHAFGNPFKLDKKNNMSIVDEVGEVNAAVSLTEGQAQQPTNGGGRRRRAASEAGTSATAAATTSRPKRRPGPIDPNRLAAWRRRYRAASSAASPSGIFEEEPSSSASIDLDVRSEPGEELALRMAEEDEEEEEGGGGEVEETMEVDSRQWDEGREEAEEGQQRGKDADEAETSLAPELMTAPATVPSSSLNGGGIGDQMMTKPDEQEEDEGLWSLNTHRVPTGTRNLPSVAAAPVVNQRVASKPSAGELRVHAGASASSAWNGPTPAGSSASSSWEGPSASVSRQQRRIPPMASFSDTQVQLGQADILAKQRLIRQIVRQKGPPVANLAERVAGVAASSGLPSCRKRELLELGMAEAKRFKRETLCELLGQRMLSIVGGATGTAIRQNGYR